MMLECSTGELLARDAFMHHDDQGHDALMHHAVLSGLICLDVQSDRARHRDSAHAVLYHPQAQSTVSNKIDIQVRHIGPAGVNIHSLLASGFTQTFRLLWLRNDASVQ